MLPHGNTGAGLNGCTMAKLAILASGSGSNFEALTTALRGGCHEVCLLICDRPGAMVLERAARLNVPARLISYKGRPKTETETELAKLLQECGADLVALAGFMRLLGPELVRSFRGRLVNIHPSLLPSWPGTHSIERAFAAGDSELGVTVHLVDEGMDTGPILAQARVPRLADLAATEAAIHAAEHRLYADVIINLLDSIAGKTC